jgi:hypothetical protein
VGLLSSLIRRRRGNGAAERVAALRRRDYDRGGLNARSPRDERTERDAKGGAELCRAHAEHAVNKAAREDGV